MVNFSFDINHIEAWIFDLDNTLYPSENKLFHQVDRRMGEFIAQRLEISIEAARLMQKSYFREHGTTLRGLMSEQDVAPQDYLDFIHDINFDLLEPNPVLKEALRSLKGKKIIYTNASLDYAEKVLTYLGLQDLFSDIFDIEAADYLPKPEPGGYQKIVSRHGLVPSRCVMVEDMARNLVPAHDMGMKTVWLDTDEKWSSEGKKDSHIDYIAPDLTLWLKSLVS